MMISEDGSKQALSQLAALGYFNCDDDGDGEGGEEETQRESGDGDNGDDSFEAYQIWTAKQRRQRGARVGGGVSGSLLIPTVAGDCY